ncbi:MAG TPA: DUF885 family protein [Verrucomicrobiae bacterium]|jgi:uncharacterized protein (DUF885 family)
MTHHLFKGGRRVPVLSLLIVFGGFAPRLISQAAPANEPLAMADFIREYQADENSVSRFYDLEWSETRFGRLERHYREWQMKLKSLDFDALDEQGRIDYLLLRNKLNSESTALRLDRERLEQMKELLPFRLRLLDLESARRRMAPVDAAAAAEIVGAIPDQVKKLKARIKKEKPKGSKEIKAEDASAKTKDAAAEKSGDEESKEDSGPPLKISPVLARRTAETVDDLRAMLKTWSAYYIGFQPEFSWWMKKPDELARTALEDYAKFLREEIAGLKGKDEDPLVGDPIGAQALSDDLAAESIPYTPEELIAIARHEFDFCEGELRKAAGEMGFGDDWKAALAKVKADYVPPGQQNDLVADLGREAVRFVTEKDLVTVPPLCDETWRLNMSSVEVQKTLPFAAYGGQNMTVAYANEEMKTEDKLMAMRNNNRHFTRIVVPHELIPGHHLQGFMAQRNRTYRSIFSTPFLVEGWALYWELKLYDLGYGKTPEDRMGMLFWRIHRCARIIVSLKFHLGEMTPKEMVDFLVERVGHEKSGATGEVRRFIGGGYSPLYQCGYMIGGIELRALHHELVDSGKMTERQFNDTVLTYNAIPIEFIRAGMENVPLRRDQPASWEFYGPHPKYAAPERK